ncbi:acyl carrier protein phosphodiesterase [Frigoriglobus tundricola]|uniref:Acyl carrier protein phosphodiesterase n=1 Tax=Frigoriglobus tundricola TaxID=2774151 RepID=A0A6M5YJR1_9BACT|nr:ACP phosphodiesterase [Frigoriglobus tundricola]QJW94218.1 Acyl carrier protein phosphodiesterase [Frigoriglobus tundricola]
MNLLAHALLSGADLEVRLGNVLADFVKGRDRLSMPPAFLEGVRQHQAIDAFTDSHPVVSRSKARVRDYRHATGILVDVFYDHFLTLSWHRFSAEPLERFNARLYAEFGAHTIALPPEAKDVLEQIVRDDWFGSYGSIAGVEDTLTRVSQRLEARTGRDFRLGSAVSQLVAHLDELAADFAEFFPLLRAHVETVRAA